MLKSSRAESATVNDRGAFFVPNDTLAGVRVRTCRECGFVGPETLFKRTDHRQNICNKCETARRQADYRANAEAEKARSKAYYDTHRAERQACSRAYAKSQRGRLKNREAVRRYKNRYPERTSARHSANLALKRGDLSKPKVCQALGCSSMNSLHAHHSDYGRPLSVDWLCREHHEAVHHVGPVKLKASASRKYARAPKPTIAARLAA